MIADINKENQRAATLLANTREVIAQDLRKIEAIEQAFEANRVFLAQTQQELQSVGDNEAVLEKALMGMKEKEQSWRELPAANPSPALDQEIRQLQATIAHFEHDLRAFYQETVIAFLIGGILPETRMTDPSLPESQVFSDQPQKSRIPQFPWPPPRASSTVVIPSQLLEVKAGVTTLGDVDRRIKKALAENGYFDSSYYAVPGGFALVTRIEQINDDGTPKAGVQRWSIEIPRLAILSLTAYLRALFLAPLGYYRVIVFLITPYSFVPREEPVTAEQANDWAIQGGNQLPSFIARRYLYRQGYHCTAIIYEFARRTESDEPTILAPGRLQGRIHLEKAGIWGALTQ